MPGWGVVVLHHPDDIHQVLVARGDRYTKGFPVQRAQSPFGKGLIVSDGPLWQRQRRLENALQALAAHFDLIAQRPIQIPLAIPTPANRRFTAALGVLDAQIDALLARPGELLAKLVAARDEAADLAAAAADPLNKLPRALAAVSEAARLYPPIQLIAREAIAPDEVRGYTLAPGTLVLISPGSRSAIRVGGISR